MSNSTAQQDTSDEFITDDSLLLAVANTANDGKGSKAGQARAKKLALQKNKDITKVLSVKRQTGGYMVKVLKTKNRVQEVWIAD